MKRNLLIIFLCLNFFSSHSQNYWAKTIQLTHDNDEMYRSKSFVDSSGNFYMLNHLYQAQDTLLSVSKFNNSGNLLWSYYYIISLPNGTDYAYLVQSKDGLPAIIFYRSYTTAVTLIKLDKQGNVIHTKSYYIPKSVNFYGMISTSDSGYLAYGYMLKLKVFSTYVLKFDSLFNIEWTYRQVVDSNSSFGWSAVETKDNYYIGGSYSFGKYFYTARPYILKLKKNGEAVKAKIISNGTEAACYGITQLMNNHLFTYSYSGNSSKTAFTELDLSLNIVSQTETTNHKTFFWMSSSDSLIYFDFMNYSVIPNRRSTAIFDKNGNFLMGMDNANYDIDEIIPAGGSSFYLRTWPGWYENYFDIFKVDTSINDNGCISKFYQLDLIPSTLYDTIVRSPQYSYPPTDTIVNVTRSINTITTTDFCLNLSVDEHISPTFNFFPNPANTLINVTLNRASTISVLNLLGEVVIRNYSFGESRTITLDVSSLSSGIYFIKVDNEVKKFVKE